MIVKIGDFFILLTFEDKDFSYVGGKQLQPKLLAKMKAAIPEQERHYLRRDKTWVIDNNEHNKAVIEELRET